MNDVDFPVDARPRGDRRCRGGRPGADQGQHGRAPRAQRGRASCPWPATSASAATSCASSSTWTWATPTAGDSRTSCRPRRSSPPSTPRCPSRRCRPTTRARSPTAGATATGAARSASSPRSPSRSAAPARAPASPPRGCSTPASSACAGHDLRGPLRAGASDAELAERIARPLGRAHRPLLRASVGGDGRAAQGRDVAHRRLRRAARGRPSERALGADAGRLSTGLSTSTGDWWMSSWHFPLTSWITALTGMCARR